MTLITLSACNNNAGKSTKQQNQEQKLEKLKIIRPFDVEPNKVFEACTNQEDMIVWWTLDTKFNIDLQVGGHYEITRSE